MGNSSSSSSRREAPPTAPTNAQDTAYYQQCTANKEPVDFLALAVSYAPLYQNYMERLNQSLSQRKYKFVAKIVSTSDYNDAKCINALAVKGRLNVSGINKVMNELCKQGRFHDDVKIQFDLELEMQDEQANNELSMILMMNSLQTAGPIVCEAHEKMFVRGWGVMGTTTVSVKLTMEDLEPDTIKISGPFLNMETFFRNQYSYLWGSTSATTNDDASIQRQQQQQQQQPGQTEECCICLEPLDVEEDDEELYHMRCGHCIHSICCRQLLQQDPTSLCPICRQAILRAPPRNTAISSTQGFVIRGMLERMNNDSQARPVQSTNNGSSRRTLQWAGPRRRMSSRLVGNNGTAAWDESQMTSADNNSPHQGGSSTRSETASINHYDTVLVLDHVVVTAMLFFLTVMVLLVLRKEMFGGFLLCLLCVHLYNWFTDENNVVP